MALSRTILVLDDDPRRVDLMRRCLDQFKEFASIFFDNAPDAVAWLAHHGPEVTLISLDHDLGPNRIRDRVSFDPGTGRDVVDYLTTRSWRCPVIVATTNSLARPGMLMRLEDSGFIAISVIPFGDLTWIRDTWMPAVERLLPPQ